MQQVPAAQVATAFGRPPIVAKNQMCFSAALHRCEQTGTGGRCGAAGKEMRPEGRDAGSTPRIATSQWEDH
jgi:hypothetical protein